MKRRSGFGWMELIIGIALAVLGIFTFVYPDNAVTTLVIIYGIIAIITGIADVVLYVRVDKHLGFGPTVSLISGILSVMAGAMLLVYPNAGKWVLSLLFPIWFIAHCLSRLSHLNTIRFIAGNFVYWFTMIVNIIGLVLGVVMIFSPNISVAAVAYIVGAYLVLFGIRLHHTCVQSHRRGQTILIKQKARSSVVLILLFSAFQTVPPTAAYGRRVADP